MSVAVYINKASQAQSLISWGLRFADADITKLLVVVPRRQKQATAKFDPLTLEERSKNELFSAVFDAIESHSTDHVVLKETISSGEASSDHDRILVETLELIASAPEESFVEQFGDLSVETLILPAPEDIQTNLSQSGWEQKLYHLAPCETFMVRGAPTDGPLNVLVVSNHDAHTDSALRRAEKIASSRSIITSTEAAPTSVRQADRGTVEFLLVRPDDDEVAFQIAELHAQKLLSQAGLPSDAVTPEIVLCDHWSDVLEKRDTSAADLILIGTRHLRTMRSFFRLELPNAGPDKNRAIACYRPSTPLGKRLQKNLQLMIRSVVPQLEKEGRVRLVARLQEGSHFNFDFSALIALSTIIAALGLLDDSSAVVIGAMLVAPLMTPLVGIGFALVQGNARLMRTALLSVFAGFALAFGIGVFLGAIAHLFAGLPISPQMAQRDFPHLIDLFVALFSGMAGAYALSRPNLISALPGVAIAAALVPPIATAGMALMMGDAELGGGALLLFFTNIVAIVLGTAVTFWAVGINTHLVKSSDGQNERPQRMWPRYWFLAFVVLSFLLATEMGYLAFKERNLNKRPVIQQPASGLK